MRGGEQGTQEPQRGQLVVSCIKHFGECVRLIRLYLKNDSININMNSNKGEIGWDKKKEYASTEANTHNVEDIC